MYCVLSRIFDTDATVGGLLSMFLYFGFAIFISQCFLLLSPFCISLFGCINLFIFQHIFSVFV